MKTRVLLIVCWVWIPLVSPLSAQDPVHRGFYISMQLGPAFGKITGTGDEPMTVTGAGIGFDLQVGGSLRENFILHGTIGLKSIYGPTLNKVKIDEQYSFDEFIFGIGTTYYLKNNFFVTGTIGTGNFAFTDDKNRITSESADGPSFQLKVGKEWWITSRWGLGLALEYAGTRVEDALNNWTSNRFGVRFTATLNGLRQLSP